MSTQDNGGSAFQTIREEFDHEIGRWRVVTDDAGISVRDYFMAHAPAMPQPMRKMAESLNKRENGKDVFDFAEYAEFEATWRDAYAKAMLKARQS